MSEHAIKYGIEWDTSQMMQRLAKAVINGPAVQAYQAVRFAALWEAEMHKEVPHDTGHLERCLYTKVHPDGTVEGGIQGCKYGVAVHERMVSKKGKPIRYKKPGAKAHFVSDPLFRVGRLFLLEDLRNSGALARLFK
jgi:hypothetical protein